MVLYIIDRLFHLHFVFLWKLDLIPMIYYKRSLQPLSIFKLAHPSNTLLTILQAAPPLNMKKCDSCPNGPRSELVAMPIFDH